MESYCNPIIYIYIFNTVWYGSLLNRTKIVSLSLSRISYRSKQSKLFLWKSKASKKADVTTLSDCSWLHVTWLLESPVNQIVQDMRMDQHHLYHIWGILRFWGDENPFAIDFAVHQARGFHGFWRKQVPQIQLEQLCQPSKKDGIPSLVLAGEC